MMNQHPWVCNEAWSDDHIQQEISRANGSTSAETELKNDDAKNEDGVIFETLWQQWPWGSVGGEDARSSLEPGFELPNSSVPNAIPRQPHAAPPPLADTVPTVVLAPRVPASTKRKLEVREQESDSMLMQVGQTNWRKYGQKILKGKDSHGLVRCYFRCTWPGCEVKKRVEKGMSTTDEPVNHVTITGVHNHNLQGSRPQAAGTMVNRPEGMQILEAAPKKEARSDMVSLDKRVLGLVMQNQNNFIVADPHMRDCPIIFASRGFCDLSGYALDDLLGKNCRLLQGKDTNKTTVSQIATAISSCKEIHAILLNYTKNGTPFWNLLHLSPVFDVDKRLVSLVGSQVNVSAAVGLDKPQAQLPAGSQDLATTSFFERPGDVDMSQPQMSNQQMSTTQVITMSQMSSNQQMGTNQPMSVNPSCINSQMSSGGGPQHVTAANQPLPAQQIPQQQMNRHQQRSVNPQMRRMTHTHPAMAMGMNQQQQLGMPPQQISIPPQQISIAQQVRAKQQQLGQMTTNHQ